MGGELRIFDRGFSRDLSVAKRRPALAIAALLAALSAAVISPSLAYGEDNEKVERVVPFTQSRYACVNPEADARAFGARPGPEADSIGKEERWYFSRAIPVVTKKLFLESVNLGPKAEAPIEAYTQAVTLELSGATPELRAFGAFWQGRIFLDRGMITLAHQMFASLAGSPPRAEAVGVQAAALECLYRISARYRGFEFPDRVGQNLPALQQEFRNVAWTGPHEEMHARAATLYALSLLSRNRPKTEIDPILALFRSGGNESVRQTVLRGFYLVRQADFASAGEEFARLMSGPLADSARWPMDLRRFEDEIYLTAARVQYRLRNYTAAAAALRRVPKESNYTVRELAELSWVHLMLSEYKETVGVALNLQKGGFRNTFAPESLIVMAMAFNEVCQFPFAFRSIRFFYRKYKKAYEWLKTRYTVAQPGAKPLAATVGPNQRPYALVVDFLQTEKSPVPMAILTEWTRSSVFTSLQELINLNLDERKLNRRFRVYQDRKLLAMFRALQAKIKSTPKSNRTKQERLKLERVEYQRMADATKKFREQFAAFDKNFNSNFQTQVEVINRDLDIRAVSMLQKMRELVERAYLIQVDIYNGASEDIVWRNAHPEYVDFVDKVKREENSRNADQVLNWGPVRSLTDDNDELWEDELDSLKAGVFDNCSNRDRYMDSVVLPKKTQGAATDGASEGGEGTQSSTVAPSTPIKE